MPLLIGLGQALAGGSVSLWGDDMNNGITVLVWGEDGGKDPRCIGIEFIPKGEPTFSVSIGDAFGPIESDAGADIVNVAMWLDLSSMKRLHAEIGRMVRMAERDICHAPSVTGVTEGA
jgi:hypothetical protein